MKISMETLINFPVMSNVYACKIPNFISKFVCYHAKYLSILYKSNILFITVII